MKRETCSCRQLVGFYVMGHMSIWNIATNKELKTTILFFVSLSGNWVVDADAAGIHFNTNMDASNNYSTSNYSQIKVLSFIFFPNAFDQISKFADVYLKKV